MIEELLHVEPHMAIDDSDMRASIVNWSPDDRHGGIRLKHFMTVSKVEWHRNGDYLSTLIPSDILSLAVNALIGSLYAGFIIRSRQKELLFQLLFTPLVPYFLLQQRRTFVSIIC